MTYELSELKKIRKQLNLTQKQLADRANVSQSMIAKIESGRLDPGYTKTKQIFDALDTLTQNEALLAKDVMNKKIVAVQDSQKVSEVIKLMKKHGISQLPILRGVVVVGKVSERLLLEKLGEEDIRNKSVGEIMDEAPPIISEQTRSDAIVSLLKYFSLVLVAEKGELRGVITKADLLEKVYQ